MARVLGHGSEYQPSAAMEDVSFMEQLAQRSPASAAASPAAVVSEVAKQNQAIASPSLCEVAHAKDGPNDALYNAMALVIFVAAFWVFYLVVRWLFSYRLVRVAPGGQASPPPTPNAASSTIKKRY